MKYEKPEVVVLDDAIRAESGQAQRFEVFCRVLFWQFDQFCFQTSGDCGNL